MTATPTPPLEGTQSFNQIEMLWDRYRSLIITVVIAAFGAIGVNYALKYFNQKKTDEAWSSFATSINAEESYGDLSDFMKQVESLSTSVASVDLTALEKAVAGATPAQKPFLLMALARRAMVAKEWDRAEKALNELKTGYPKHSLVVSTPHPVQVQEEVKKEEEPNPASGQKPKPELKPVVAGSSVDEMLAEIAAARSYTAPAQFQPVVPPADAPKIKFEFSSGYGDCVIALMPNSPLHQKAILALAESDWWKGIAVDEIHRPTKGRKQPRELHFGYESTKDEDDRTKWLTTEPSKNIVEFEKNSLSHFAGAVSMQEAADGKSCADRMWISVDDAPKNDGSRVIVGYVVEGLDNLTRICDASLSAQDEAGGSGRPTENIRITAVTVLK